MQVAGEPVGRLVFRLFADKTPKAAENFRALCTGEKASADKGIGASLTDRTRASRPLNGTP